MRTNTVSDNIKSDNGEYVVRRSKKLSVIAFILCVLVSFSIWLYVVNTQDIEYTRTVAASVVCNGGERVDKEFVLELSTNGLIEVSGPSSVVDFIYNARIDVPYSDYNEGDKVNITVKNIKLFDNSGKIISSKDVDINTEGLSVTIVGVKEK